MLGKPKIKTISPFGGYAYTFYTNDDYDNYLYIETTEDEKIISYGSIDENYSVVGNNSRGDEYVEDNSDWSGYFYTDENNKVIGGIYYNPRVLFDGDTEQIFDLYKDNYFGYPKYQMGISEHAVSMVNALAKISGKDIELEYNDYLSYLYSLVNVQSADLSGFENIALFRSYLLRPYVLLNPKTNYLVNPLLFADLIKDSDDVDFAKFNTVIFGYDNHNDYFYSYVTTKEIAESKTYSSDSMKFYALSLLDDKMTETEKALVLAQYVQEGNKVDSGTIYNEEINEMFIDLASRAGIYCGLLYSKNHYWDVCYLDNEWTYISIDQKKNSKYEFIPYTFNFRLNFKSRTTIENSALKDSYDFKNLYYYNDSFENYPIGVDKEIDSYTSRVLYDEDYKYYEKLVYDEYEKKRTYIYKENRQTGDVTKLQEALYNADGSGLVKDGNILYYISTKNELCTYNLLTNEVQVLESSKSSESKIVGVFLEKDGKIYYSTKDEENISINKIISDWPQEKTYHFDDSSYENFLIYYETSKGIAIAKDVARDSLDPMGKLYIPEKINNKPVVAIEASAFRNTKLIADLVIPKDVLYIGNGAFYDSRGIKSLKFNDKLRAICGGAFAETLGSGVYDKIIKIPDSVTFVGAGAFSGWVSIVNLELGSGIKVLFSNVFTTEKIFKAKADEVKVPEGLLYIKNKGLPAAKAYFLPKSLIEVDADVLANAEEVYMYPETKIVMDTELSTTEIYYITPDLETTISLDNNETTLYFTDRTYQMKYDLKPKYYFDDTVLTWSSSDPRIADVTSLGEVIFYKGGDVTISVKSSHGGEDSIDLNIVGLSLNEYSYRFKDLNDKFRLIVTASDIKQQVAAELESENKKVATIDAAGLVEPKGAGFAFIHAYDDFFGTADCLVYVPLPINLSDGSKGYIGDLNQDGIIDEFDAQLLESIIENNKATPDQVLIGDTNGDGILSETDLRVYEKMQLERITFNTGEYRKIEKVTLDRASSHLLVGDSQTLIAAINPEDTTDSKNLVWESSNDSVVKVSQDGEITALKNGMAVITVTTVNGKKASCTVIVGDYNLGDMDTSGEVTMKDAFISLKVVSKQLPLTANYLKLGDINNNGKLEMNDAFYILKKASKQVA